MFNDLKKFLTNGNLEEIKFNNKLSIYFLIYYFSFNPKTHKTAKKFNTYLFKINNNLLWNLIFLNSTGQKFFKWDSENFIKKKTIKKNFLNEKLKEKIKKYFSWSENEWESGNEFIIKNKNYWIKKFALTGVNKKC